MNEMFTTRQFLDAGTRGFQNGRKTEQKRIIKLLEVLWQKTQGTDIPAVVILPEAIALIKGEQK